MALPKAAVSSGSTSPTLSTPPSSSDSPDLASPPSSGSPDSASFSGRDYSLFSPTSTALSQVPGRDNSTFSASASPPPMTTFPVTYAFHSTPSPVSLESQMSFTYFRAAPAPQRVLPPQTTPSFTYSSTSLASPFLPFTPSPFLQTPRTETDCDDSHFRFDVASPFYPMSASPSSVVLSPVAPSGVERFSPPPHHLHPPPLLLSPPYYAIPDSLSSHGFPATSATNVQSGNVLPSPSMISIDSSSMVQNSYHRPEICPQFLAQKATDVNLLCQDFSKFSAH